MNRVHFFSLIILFFTSCNAKNNLIKNEGNNKKQNENIPNQIITERKMEKLDSSKQIKPYLGIWHLKSNINYFGFDQIEINENIIVLYKLGQVQDKIIINNASQDKNYKNKYTLITTNQFYCFFFNSKKVFFNYCCEDCPETELYR